MSPEVQSFCPEQLKEELSLMENGWTPAPGPQHDEKMAEVEDEASAALIIMAPRKWDGGRETVQQGGQKTDRFWGS